MDEAPTVGCRWRMAWAGGGRQQGWRWTDSQRLPPSTHPHLLSTQMIPLLQKDPQRRGWREGGREVGESSVYSWVTASRSEPQGEAEFTVNGKQIHIVTPALVFTHVLISVSPNHLTSFHRAANCVMVCFSLLLTGCCQSSDHSHRARPQAGQVYCWSFEFCSPHDTL